jgi:hypothetical protein
MVLRAITTGVVFFFSLLLWPGTIFAADWWQRAMETLRGSSTASQTSLSTNDIAEGLREALRIGTDNVVSQLGRHDGYYRNPTAHIPLPYNLQRIQTTLDRVGMSHLLDDLELRMNRAAEIATPRAKRIFIDAISQMTLDDVRGIYNGPDDAATRYFERVMSAPLADEFTPIVNQGLSEAGAIQSYDNLISRYQQIPFAPDIKADLSQHVVDYAIDIIFDYLAMEETAIRNNPARRTTEILQKVFSNR